MISSGMSSVLTVFVSSHNAQSERRFDKSLTILGLKERMEAITGIPAGNMKLDLLDASNNHVLTLDDDTKMLGYYPIVDFMTLKATNSGLYRLDDYTDVSKVEKYEMPEAEYDQKRDSVRAFKKAHKLGRFADKMDEVDPKETLEEELATQIHVNDRCLVQANEFERRASVKFVGQVSFGKGVWVGVQYDEPVGKHNGTVQGFEYFSCPNMCGAMVRPSKVAVGDYPELDPFDDEL